ncbi:hypothetical protein LSUB1_G005673 [Lachnellula subtilissima]|uniref:Cyclase n=1 Tax=Lachnellula subtilissima TaxID=602034 RepID=A0A8H8RLN3_9HELO|nr:hypothetical protein LSUB1_G005673 [Lachnellula subtilissima]
MQRERSFRRYDIYKFIGKWDESLVLGLISAEHLALNLLTPSTVLDARSEIKTGISVQLDWSLDNLGATISGRKNLEHSFIDYKALLNVYGHDDSVSFNTQCGSQWDGFGYYGDQATGLYYNGTKHENIIRTGNENLGIHNWCARGGIVGRGVLLDYVAYMEETGQELPNPCTRFGITVDVLDKIVAHQGIEWRDGDILFIRSGFVRWYNAAGPEEREKNISGPDAAFIGVKTNDASRDWLWNHHFSAVAGDTLAFEQYPILSNSVALHEYLLPRWGTPIGEMFDLETLSKQCAAHKRWSFFFTGAPLNIPGGIASPPNAIAIF